MLDRIQLWLGGAPAEEPPTARWEAIERDLPCLDCLPAEARPRLRRMARDFIAQKQFYGAHGFALDDDILLSIALQACLPVLNLGLERYRHWIGIVVYDGDFVVEREVVDEDGIVHSGPDILQGEAWHGGPVILAWDAAAPPGCNVVIHEFAHSLDMANGEADGFPPLRAGMSRDAWSNAFSRAYDDLCRRVDHDLDTALDPYASEHPAEFFAVASEAFFETPLDLREAYPAVYAQLAAFYGLDTAAGEAALPRADPHPAP